MRHALYSFLCDKTLHKLFLFIICSHMKIDEQVPCTAYEGHRKVYEACWPHKACAVPYNAPCRVASLYVLPSFFSSF